MPCEGCSTQFTVFRRKRICSECRRYYCNNCLNKHNNGVLCERCTIFSKRPLLKIDLLKLKPKDLIFYLQSKHISTTGCVEKEELVNLILTHANTTERNGRRYSNRASFESSSQTGESNHFDNLKQSCQNFFNNFTVKIATDLNFDPKSNKTSPESENANISDQPRFSTREIPKYSNSSNLPNASNTAEPNTASSTTTSSPSSPIASLTSLSPQSVSSQSHRKSQLANETGNGVRKAPIHSTRLFNNVNNESTNTNTSGCECSDDELLVMYQVSKAQKSPSPVSPSKYTCEEERNVAGPSGASVNLTVEVKQDNESSTSSFEELGAVGGSDTNNVGPSSGSGNTLSDNEHWLFVQKSDNDVNVQNNYPEISSAQHSEQESANNTTVALVPTTSMSRHSVLPYQRPNRVLRRRSDGFVYNRQLSDGGITQYSSEYPRVVEETEATESIRTRFGNCTKCGKNKSNIKRHVAKFRNHLESSQMSETQIKQELEDFLKFLDNRAKSFDCSDSESNMELASGAGAEVSPDFDGRVEFAESDAYDNVYGDDDGIHVYAHNDESNINNSRFDSRFVNLGDFKSSDEFEELSVKQLKEILMLNRVDYKGCCEKQELLERVYRLWNNFHSCPAVEKLPTDELCKICMDAPIECVILECGHMATCTNCGKVLSECPICRQYIVRVVRFFRA